MLYWGAWQHAFPLLLSTDLGLPASTPHLIQHACFSWASCDPNRRDEDDRGTGNAWSNKEEAKQAFKELLKDKVLVMKGRKSSTSTSEWGPVCTVTKLE